MFDITMTATLRPELIQRTFDSFNKNLFREHAKEARLIVNIDLVGGDPEFARHKINEIIRSLPYKIKTTMFNPSPNFAHAWQWCMGQVRSEYVFNLEEDWELSIPISFEEMIDTMKRNKHLAHLRLSQFKSTENSIKAWQNFAYWNGSFFEYDSATKHVDGWAGHPSINRSSFLMGARELMDPERNPEKQIKGNFSLEMHKLIDNHRFGIYHPQDTGPAIKDLGREWMAVNGYQKAGSKAWFTNWEEI